MTRRLFTAALFALALVAARAEEVPGLILPFKTVKVASPVFKDIIEKVLVKEGEEVQLDQPVVQLRSEREALEVDLYEKTAKVAEFTAKGAKALFNDKIASEVNWRTKDAEWEQAKTQLALARVKLKEKTIRAPLGGIVTKTYKESGESIDQAEPLMDVVNIDQVFAQFFLDPKHMTTVKTGQTLKVKVPALGNAEFTGKVDFIAPNVDAGSQSFRLKVLIENPQRQIKAGMKATLGI